MVLDAAIRSGRRGGRHAINALVAMLLGGLLVATATTDVARAGATQLRPSGTAVGKIAAKKETLDVVLPRDGQLAIAKLEVKIKGKKKPKLKTKLKRKGSLPGDVMVVSQAAKPKEPKTRRKKGKKGKKKRAAAIVAIGNGPGPAAGGSARPAGAILKTTELVLRSPGNRVKLIAKPTKSGLFVNTFGPEPAEVQTRFKTLLGFGSKGFPEDSIALDDQGRFEFPSKALKPQGKPKQLSNAGPEGFTRDDFVAAAVASGFGPPATLDSGVYGWTSGRFTVGLDAVRLVSAAYEPQPGDERLVFNQATYSTDVHGAQASPVAGNDILLENGARCATGSGSGSVHGVAGPNGGSSALCHFAQPGRDLFIDLYFERPEYGGGGAGMLMPFPEYDSGEGFGEAIAGPEVTTHIGVPGSY